jgi:hypothetical protein
VPKCHGSPTLSQRFPFPEFSGEEITKIIASLKAEGLASLGGLPAGIWDRNRLEQGYTYHSPYTERIFL